MITVNPDITQQNTIQFGRLIDEIDKKGIRAPEYNNLIVKAAIKASILIGGREEEVDALKTGQMIALSTKATNAFIEELKPIDDPN
jgi:hypothetical protein